MYAEVLLLIILLCCICPVVIFHVGICLMIHIFDAGAIFPPTNIIEDMFENILVFCYYII